MPGHALNYEPYASVNPTGAPANDYERINADPNAFGARIAKATEAFGGAVEKASSTGFDVEEQRQAQLNKVDASDRLSKASDAFTDESAKYGTLQGHAALLGIEDHKAKLKGIYDDALANSSNPAVKTMLAESAGRTLDRYYDYAAKHAAQQENTYNRTVAQGNLQSRTNQAVWAYRNGDFPGFEREMDHAVAETYNTYELEGYTKADIEPKAAQTRGKIILDTTKLILDHPEGGPAKAAQFASQYKGKIDAQSNVAIDGMLRSATNTIEGHKDADIATGRTHAPAVSGAIRDVAVRYGIDPATLTRTVQVESGGNPNAKTGSYKGLTQLSQGEFDKYNPYPGRSIYDPEANLAAGAAKMKAEGDQFARNFGRAPSSFDTYMIHQQGLAGYSHHLANPEAPAWQNMAATGEGKQKGDAWAKAAIWGNIPDQYKASFGNVNNVTSRDFLSMWQQKWGQGGGAFAPSGGAGIPNRAGINEPGERPQFVNATGEEPQNAAVASPGALLHGLVPKTVAEQRLLDNEALQSNPARAAAAWQQVQRTYQVADGDAASAERAQKQAEHQQKVQSDSNELQVMKNLYSNKPTVTAQQIVQLGDEGKLSREAVERLIPKLKGAPGEHDSATYGPGWWETFQAIHAPVGDPGRITDPSQLYRIAGAHGALTMAGVDRGIKEIEAKKTPDGEAETSMKKQFFEHVARPQITFTNEELKLRDHDGDANFLRFQAAAFAAYDNGRKNGKTPSQLLDPDSNDYIGKLIDRFKPDTNKTFADRMSDAATKSESPSWSRVWDDLTGTTNFNKLQGAAPAAEAPKAPAIDLASINSLADLKAAYDRKQIDPAAARKLAQERGWTRSRTPQPLDIDATRLRNADQ